MSEELHDLVGPYALGAIELADAEIFEAHLETCAECQAELFAMSDAVLELDAAAAAAPAAPAEGPATVHELPQRSRLPWYAAVAAAIAVIAGLWVSGIFETTRVEEIASANDVETISLAGDIGQVQVVLSDSAAGVALADANLDPLDEPQLYVLWVIREGGDGPEFVGNIAEFDEVNKAWDIDVTDVDVLAISIEDAPSPETPSDQIVYVGQRTDS